MSHYEMICAPLPVTCHHIIISFVNYYLIQLIAKFKLIYK